jgi:hypothetical protein
MNRYSLFASLIAAVSLPALADTYKWVDDRGVTHYSSTLPPEYASKNRQILNKSGVVIRTQDVLTPDERRAKQAESAKVSADEALARDQKRYDKSLVDSYSSVGEIELARSRSMQQLDAGITSINSQIAMVANHLSDLKNEVADRRKANKKVPSFMLNEIKESGDRLSGLQQDLDKSKAKRAETQARFEAEKARYKELTGN